MGVEQVLSTTFTADVSDALKKIADLMKAVLEISSTSSTFAASMGSSSAALASFTSSLISATAATAANNAANLASQTAATAATTAQRAHNAVLGIATSAQTALNSAQAASVAAVQQSTVAQNSFKAALSTATATLNQATMAQQTNSAALQAGAILQNIHNNVVMGGIAAQNAYNTSALNTAAQVAAAGQAIANATKHIIAATAAQTAQNQVIAQTPGLLGTIVSTIKSFAIYSVASSAIRAFTSSISSSIETVMAFNQTLHSLQAITGASSTEITAMGDTIRSVSRESKFNVVEIGKGMEIMGQAGLTASQSMQTIKSASTLATGSMEKMDKVVDLLTSTMSAFQINTIESGRVIDIMAIACNRSKMDIDKLRTSLNYVGVIASQSGLSLEQTTASLMLLADRGMKASTIGTGLRQVLDKLIAPNEKLREAYKSHGMELDKISPLTVGYEGALQNLTKTLYDSAKGTVDTSKAFELFGIRGAQAATILIQSYASGEWKETIDSFSEVGAASKMASDQMQGLSYMWSNLVSRVKELMVAFGEGGLSFAIKKIIELFINMTIIVQKFISIDWGILGNLVQYFAAFATFVGVLTAAFASYNAVIGMAVVASSLLNKVILSLLTSLETLIVTLLANPFLAVVTVLTSIILVFKMYNNQVLASVDAHNKFALELAQSASILGLFQQNMLKNKDDTNALAKDVNRLKSEYPELANEVAKVAGVNDIASLSFEELSNAIQKVREKDLNQAIQENISAVNELGRKAAITGLMMKGLGDGWDYAKEKFKQLDVILVPIGNGLKSITDYFRSATEQSADSSERMKAQVKSLAEAFVNAGKDISKSLDQQKAASFAKLDAEVKAGNISKEIYSSLAKEIVESYEKIEKRQELSKISYAKYVNEIGSFLKTLSAKQRAEVQTLIDEEEKAVERFEKFANDKNIIGTEKDAELLAIHERYYFKISAAMSESSKKEYETTAEKYARESKLIDTNLSHILTAMEEEKSSFKFLNEWKNLENGKVSENWKTHLAKMQVYQENYQDVVRKKQLLTFEQEKKTAADAVSELKANLGIRLSLMDSYTLEKMQLESKALEQERKLNELMIKGLNEVAEIQKQKGTFGTAEQESYNARMEELVKKETEIRGREINKAIEQKRYFFEELNALEDRNLQAIKEKYATESGIINQSAAVQETLLKSNLEKELIAIETKEKNVVASERKKFEATQNYYNEELELAEENLQKQLDLNAQEYEAEIKFINDRFALTESFNEKTASLGKEQLEVSAKDLEARMALSEKIMVRSDALLESEANARKSFYAEEIKDLTNSVDQQIEINKKGTDVRKSIYVKETQLTKEELDKRGIWWTEFEDGIYTIAKQTDDKVINSTKLVSRSFEEDINDRVISLKTVTDETKLQLDAQGIAYEEVNGRIYKVVTGTYEKLKESFNSLTEAEKKEFIVIEQRTVESCNKNIKTYEKFIESRRKQIDSLRQAEAATLAKIDSIEKGKIDTTAKVNDAKQAALQLTMTSEQKYASQIKSIENDLTQFRMTSNKKFLDDALSKVNSLPDKVENANKEIVVNEKQTQDARLGFIENIERGQTLAAANEIKLNKNKLDSFKKTIEEEEKKIEDVEKKIKELSELKFDIITSGFAKTVDVITQKIDDIIKKVGETNKLPALDLDISQFESKVKQVETLIQGMRDVISGKKKEASKEDNINIDVQASDDGKEYKPVTDVFKDVVGLGEVFGKDITKLEPFVKIGISGDYQNKKEPIADVVSGTENKIKELGVFTDQFNPKVLTKFIADIGQGIVDFFTGTTSVTTKLNEMAKPVDTVVKVTVEGLDQLREAVDLKNQLGQGGGGGSSAPLGDTSGDSTDQAGNQRTGGYIEAKLGGFIQYLKNGGPFSGKLPGYGGGDIVNARLEPGEFVLRKEAVKRIGVNALRGLNNLNSPVPKTLNPSTASTQPAELFSGQLHTINLNIGNVVHKVYGDSNVLNNLTSSLRRSRLMTA